LLFDFSLKNLVVVSSETNVMPFITFRTPLPLWFNVFYGFLKITFTLQISAVRGESTYKNKAKP